MYQPYIDHLRWITEKLQLEKNDPEATIHALIEIFTTTQDVVSHHDHEIDKSGTSDITLLSDEVEKENPVIIIFPLKPVNQNF